MTSNMHDILGILNGSKIKQQCWGDYVPGGGPPSLPSDVGAVINSCHHLRGGGGGAFSKQLNNSHSCDVLVIAAKRQPRSHFQSAAKIHFLHTSWKGSHVSTNYMAESP